MSILPLTPIHNDPKITILFNILKQARWFSVPLCTVFAMIESTVLRQPPQYVTLDHFILGNDLIIYLYILSLYIYISLYSSVTVEALCAF